MHSEALYSKLEELCMHIKVKLNISNIRKLDFRLSFVTLRVPSLNFETGSTGELRSKTNLLKWQNSDNRKKIYCKKTK